MPNRYKSAILRHLASDRYMGLTVDELVQTFAIAPALEAIFRRACEELVAGKTVVLQESRLLLPPPGREVVGVYRAKARGFGFLVPDSPVAGGDLFVPPGKNGSALDGDRVRCGVRKDFRPGPGGGQRFVAEVAEVLERSSRAIVGLLSKRGSQWLVEVDGGRLPLPVLVRDPFAKGAKGGDKVVVEIIRFGAEREPSEGVILRVVGQGGAPDAETASVMAAYGLDEGFPAAVLAEAAASARRMEEADPGRADCRGLLTLTIDPPDAKDYDDAISIRRLNPPGPDGAAWELLVHIADVAHFVPPGSALDDEARRRGNSTYLPRRVVPMLPEVLSNGVCSLQEGVERFALTAWIRYDAAGRVLHQRFGNTLIKSVRRLTYLEAQALIDNDIEAAKPHCRTEPVYSAEVMQALHDMNELARIIRARRLAEGMIVLHLPEVELEFDEGGKVSGAHPEDDAFTHTLIEMFMVEANEAAARLFHALGVPMVRRLHAEPDPLRLMELAQVARLARVNIPAKPGRKQLQNLLDSVRGTALEQAVHFAVLRVMMRAEYGPEHIGHYALASEHYTHFTSPIRRYPDFVVHRGLKAAIAAAAAAGVPCDFGVGRPQAKRAAVSKIGQAVRQDERVPDLGGMAEIGKQCSMTERNSADAERELRQFLVLQYLQEHMGESHEATVTGVSNAGAFLQLDRFRCDGLVPLATLGGDHGGYRYEQRQQLLVGAGSRVIGMGDRFRVKIEQIDMQRRQMELSIIEPMPGGPRPRTLQAEDFARPVGEEGGSAPRGGFGARPAGRFGGGGRGGSFGGRSGGKFGGKPGGGKFGGKPGGFGGRKPFGRGEGGPGEGGAGQGGGWGRKPGGKPGGGPGGFGGKPGGRPGGKPGGGFGGKPGGKFGGGGGRGGKPGFGKPGGKPGGRPGGKPGGRGR